MNTKLINALLFIVVAGVFLACGAKKEDDHGHSHDAAAAADDKEWKQMDEFHMVMAETFHPYKDSANLEPVKARASELASSAESWSKAELPAKVDNDDMKQKLEQLKTETSTLASSVNSADDKAIGDQLTKVHDLFHEIQEVWYGGGKHEHH
jgi:predicted nucleic acid-binding protein